MLCNEPVFVTTRFYVSVCHLLVVGSSSTFNFISPVTCSHLFRCLHAVYRTSFVEGLLSVSFSSPLVFLYSGIYVT